MQKHTGFSESEEDGLKKWKEEIAQERKQPELLETQVERWLTEEGMQLLKQDSNMNNNTVLS